MKIRQFIIVGRGKFAEVFFDRIEALSRKVSSEVLVPIKFEDALTAMKSADLKVSMHSNPAVVFHAGSGRELTDAIQFCQSHKVPMIQASSGLSYELPHPLAFTLIEAVNLSIPILKLLCLLEQRPTIFSGLEISIRESHQHSKKTIPATARDFARLLGLKTDAVQSIRDPQIQKAELLIPAQYLAGHAFHEIKIKGMGAEIEISTKILGRETYVLGAIEICRTLSNLSNRKYLATELIQEGIL